MMHNINLLIICNHPAQSSSSAWGGDDLQQQENASFKNCLQTQWWDQTLTGNHELTSVCCETIQAAIPFAYNWNVNSIILLEIGICRGICYAMLGMYGWILLIQCSQLLFPSFISHIPAQGTYVNIDEFKSKFCVLCNQLGHQDYPVKRVFNYQSM